MNVKPSGTLDATSDGSLKMPMPMTTPTTMETPSSTERLARGCACLSSVMDTLVSLESGRRGCARPAGSALQPAPLVAAALEAVAVDTAMEAIGKALDVDRKSDLGAIEHGVPQGHFLTVDFRRAADFLVALLD